MLVEITDEEGNPTGKKSIVISSFYIYSKKIGEGQGSDRIKTFAYDIIIPLTNSTILKSIGISKYAYVIL